MTGVFVALHCDQPAVHRDGDVVNLFPGDDPTVSVIIPVAKLQDLIDALSAVRDQPGVTFIGPGNGPRG
jgi:hypothetical protein